MTPVPRCGAMNLLPYRPHPGRGYGRHRPFQGSLHTKAQVVSVGEQAAGVLPTRFPDSPSPQPPAHRPSFLKVEVSVHASTRLLFPVRRRAALPAISQPSHFHSDWVMHGASPSATRAQHADPPTFYAATLHKFNFHSLPPRQIGVIVNAYISELKGGRHGDWDNRHRDQASS